MYFFDFYYSLLFTVLEARLAIRLYRLASTKRTHSPDIDVVVAAVPPPPLATAVAASPPLPPPLALLGVAVAPTPTPLAEGNCLERGFERLGRAVARSPWLYTFGALIVMVGLCSGFATLEAENRPDKQWVPEGAVALAPPCAMLTGCRCRRTRNASSARWRNVSARRIPDWSAR